MTVLTDTFVLKKSVRGDFDRQYILYTRELGKITAIAKGALKITSKLSSHLDFFYLSEVMVASGQTFFRLAGARLKTPHLKDKTNEAKVSSAYFFLAAIEVLMIDRSHDERIFLLLQNFFTGLDAARDGRDAHLILNHSLYQLLTCLGYRPKINNVRNQAQLTDILKRLITEVSGKELPDCVF
jgi:DNA repair protein RecO (recombination protein O)